MSDCIECERLGVVWRFCEATRVVPCSVCGGDGGGYEGGNERWIRCTACDGKGEFEIELEPITLEDLNDVEYRRD